MLSIGAPFPPRTCFACAAAMVQGIHAQMLAAVVNAMRTIIASIENAPNTDVAYKNMVDAHKSSFNILESLSAAFATIDGQSRKPLSECRCVGNLKVLGSDKSEFKNWNEKIINAIAQVLGTPWRKYMKSLNQTLDQDTQILDAL